MSLLSQVGWFLLLLFFVSPFHSDLHAQFTPQAKLVGTGSMARPSAGQGDILCLSHKVGRLHYQPMGIQQSLMAPEMTMEPAAPRGSSPTPTECGASRATN